MTTTSRRALGAGIAAAAALLLAPLPATAAAAPSSPAVAAAAKKAKPALKVSRLSVNRWALAPGGKVAEGDGTNGCFSMLGPAATPPSLTVYGFVTFARVPASAPATVELTTPWDAAGGFEPVKLSGAFGKVLHRVKGNGAAGAFGGGAKDVFLFSMLPTGLPAATYVDGTYAMTVTARVHGRTLRSSGRITVDCV